MIQNLAPYIWYNGQIFEKEDVNLHITNYGLHYAASVFEGERVYNGEIFKLEQHSSRLIESARLIGMKLNYSQKEIVDATKYLVTKNQLKNAYIRPIIWQNSEFLKLLKNQNKVNFSTNIAIIAILQEAKQVDYSLNLYVSDWKKISPYSIPIQSKCSAQYVTASLAKSEALSKGYDDCLLLTQDNYVAESSVSNIFFLKDKHLLTPSKSNCLFGITRNTVINEIAPKLGLTVEESPSIKLENLKDFDESFVTGTAIEIKNIASITQKNEKYLFSNNNVTNIIRSHYFQIVGKYLNV
ncbi:MAG: aminotransferase class IV [Rickettsia sp.]|nr:aminotransferase class IV [Rickettsia sp.]